MKKEPIVVYLSPADVKRLNEICQNRQIQMSTLLREIIHGWLESRFKAEKRVEP